MKTIFVILISFLVMTGIDFVRLSFAGGPLFRKHVGDILKENAEILPALGVRLLLVIGLYVFIVRHPTYGASRQQALLYGGLFGGITYGVYELTNMATIQGRSYKMVSIDMIWGAILCAITSGLLFFLSQKFL